MTKPRISTTTIQISLKTTQTIELQKNRVVLVTRIAPLPKLQPIEAKQLKNHIARPSAAENAENDLIDDETANIDYYNPNQPKNHANNRIIEEWDSFRYKNWSTSKIIGN